MQVEAETSLNVPFNSGNSTFFLSLLNEEGKNLLESGIKAFFSLFPSFTHKKMQASKCYLRQRKLFKKKKKERKRKKGRKKKKERHKERKKERTKKKERHKERKKERKKERNTEREPA